MPLFGSKKDKHHDDDTTSHSSHSSTHHSSSKHAGAEDPTDIPGGKEYKYERVEKIAVDSDGHAELKDVREDRGAEDPGMNYKDKRPPALVPSHEAGYVPPISGLDTVSSRSSYSTNPRDTGSTGLVTEKHVVRENTSDYGSSHRSRDLDTASVASTISTASHRSNVGSVVRQEAGELRQDVNQLRNQVEGLRHTERQLNPAVPPRPTGTYTETHHVSGMSAPRSEHHMVHERTEVIRQTTEPREQIVDVISVPVQRMEGSRLEHIRTGHTYTQDKDLTIPGPLIAPQIPSVTHDLLAQGSGGASAEIHASSNIDLLSNIDVNSLAPEEYERYRHRVEDLARQHEQEASAKASAYRNQVEKDAELIRKTLERQHIRDIEFRKDMVESAVDRQQHEIQLEAEYAMRALEKEREAARQALDQAKMHTNIDVRIDSAVGNTVSQGSVDTTTEHRVQETTTTTRGNLGNATRL